MIMHYLKHWHSQNCLFKRFQEYFGIFRDIDGNSATTSCVKPERKEKVSLALFENRKKCPDFGKKGPDVLHQTHSEFLHIQHSVFFRYMPA